MIQCDIWINCDCLHLSWYLKNHRSSNQTLQFVCLHFCIRTQAHGVLQNKEGHWDWQLHTWREYSITTAILPANDFSHLLQRNIFQQHEDWSHLIGEPVCMPVTWPSYTSQNKVTTTFRQFSQVTFQRILQQFADFMVGLRQWQNYLY